MSPVLIEDILYRVFQILIEPDGSQGDPQPTTSRPGSDPRALSAHHLLSPSLVSKAWNVPAISILYGNPDLTSRHPRPRITGLLETLRERPDLAARVRSYRFSATPKVVGAIEKLEELARVCVNLERVEFEGLANVYARVCLESLISTKRASQIHSLSLSTQYHPTADHPNPTFARLTVAYISHRLFYFPNLRHLTLVDFIFKPCEWTTPTYTLSSLTLHNCLLGPESFKALRGASSVAQSLRSLTITEGDLGGIQDLTVALQDRKGGWAAHLERLELEVRSGLARTTLRQIYEMPRLELFEFRGPTAGILEELVRPGVGMKRVGVQSTDEGPAGVLEAMRPLDGRGWTVVREGDAYVMLRIL